MVLGALASVAGAELGAEDGADEGADAGAVAGALAGADEAELSGVEAGVDAGVDEAALLLPPSLADAPAAPSSPPLQPASIAAPRTPAMNRIVNFFILEPPSRTDCSAECLLRNTRMHYTIGELDGLQKSLLLCG